MSDKAEISESDEHDDVEAQEAALAQALDAVAATSNNSERADDVNEPEEDPHRDRLIGISIYPNKNTSVPTLSKLVKWRTARSKLLRRDVRAEKDGPLIGGFTTRGRRCNADVDARNAVQLDIDTKVEKDQNTGAERITWAAPPFDTIRHLIDAYEYVAASSHRHDPARGIIKYRITLLPDRQITPDEHEPLLEALDELLGGILDRDAWAWSQAFYLPSCHPSRAAAAFAIPNMGELLPVDQFVARGRTIIAGKSTKTLAATPGQPAANVGRAPPPVEVMRATLRFLASRGVFKRRLMDKKDAAGRILELSWIKAGMALKVAYGDADGFNLWAETHVDARAHADAPTQWASFASTAAAGQVTVASIIKAANDNGYDPLAFAVQAQPLTLNAVDLSTFSGNGGDVSNGRVFAAVVHNRLLHVHETGEWLRFYDGRGWLSAHPGEADRAAKKVLKLLRAEAAARYSLAPEAPATKRLMAHVARTGLAHNLRAMIEMAKSEPGITARLADFDADPMVIGFPNLILNLTTWKYHKPKPRDLVSKRVRAEYDPDAECPQFQKFLREVQPDKDVRRFLRLFMGYCLTGRTSEQVFMFFHGQGFNGKSLFIELMAWLLGDYARKIATEMLMHYQRNPQGPSPDIVALKGARLIFANETEEGRRLAEARVKELTGGDTLTGRVPYGKADITFQPTHKLIVVGNHKPEITDNSIGMWRRVLLVPWDVIVPEPDRDKLLLEKLKTEASGILNWMLAGFADYHAAGLGVPAKIKAATAAYREEQDIIGDWIANECVTGPTYSVKKGDLYVDYKVWATSNGHMPLAQARLTRRLSERGYKLSTDRRSIMGLAISNSMGPTPAPTAPGVPHPGSIVPSVGGRKPP